MNTALVHRLEEADFVFAKTMPRNPHYYTLKKTWESERLFYEAVMMIREYGYATWFKGRQYTCFDINGWKYWTMGDPLETTWLINRAKIKYDTPYDQIASGYDAAFNDQASIEQDKRVMDFINIQTGDKVLDVGCGTGLVLDCYGLPIDFRYVGIDPSINMLQRLVEKHGGDISDDLRWDISVVNTDVKGYFTKRRFNKVVSLYGAMSYADPDQLYKLLEMIEPGGAGYFMLYSDSYHPVTYEKMHVEFAHHRFGRYRWPEDAEILDFEENYKMVVVRR